MREPRSRRARPHLARSLGRLDPSGVSPLRPPSPRPVAPPRRRPFLTHSSPPRTLPRNPAEKTARLRQAKAEADAEIAAYRASREASYQAIVAERSGDSTATRGKMLSDAEAQIAAVRAAVNSRKKPVMDMLKQKVTSA